MCVMVDFILTLILPNSFFSSFIRTKPRKGSFGLPTCRRDAHRNFFHDPLLKLKSNFCQTIPSGNARRIKVKCLTNNWFIFMTINPLTPRRTLVALFTKVSPKFQFYFKKGSSKKFPMSVAPMSR